MEFSAFIGASYTLQSITADNQRCVNLYPQQDESGSGKSRAILLSTPGLTRLVDVAAANQGRGTRAAYPSSKGRLFIVVGSNLYEIGSTWNILGTYPLPNETGNGPVSLTDNGSDMMILTGPNGYWFNFAANTLKPITDEVFEGGTQCGFIDGYIVFNQPNTQKFWITNLYSTVINPIGFASAEGQPDTLLGLLVDHREIWLFSTTHTEVWYDSGNANFPFSFIQGAYVSHGIANPWASARLDNTIFMVAQDEFGTGMAYRMNGYAPLRVSTFAVEQAWQKYPKKCSDLTCWTYQQDGHSFWLLDFPSGDATWAYDAATGSWHERAYLGQLGLNDGILHRGRAHNHAYAFGRHIVGDWETGYIYGLDAGVYEDDTREITRLRRAPYIVNEEKRIYFSEFRLAMEVGEGNSSATEPVTPPTEPVEPQIQLRWSDDNGHSWSPYLLRSMGKSGEYAKRVIWRRLGQARDRIFEVSTSQNNIDTVLIAAYLELSS